MSVQYYLIHLIIKKRWDDFQKPTTQWYLESS